jgi:hypothetical protein
MKKLSPYETLHAYLHPRLQVLPEYLLEPLSVQQIEDREQVNDPLSAAPELPFGHLNPAWKALLQSRQPGDELWSFAASLPISRPREEHAGYVIVRAGVPGEFMYGRLRYIEEPYPNPLLKLTPPD